MDLKTVYSIATKINESILNNGFNKSVLSDIEVHIKVSPSQLYGIDRELYRLAHDGNVDGFVHTNKVKADIDRVRFVFEPKMTNGEQT